MKFPFHILFLSGLFLINTGTAQEFPNAIAPTETINLLADPEWKDFVANVNPKISLSTDMHKIWSIREDGTLLVNGEGMGYLRTKQPYRDYHLVLEYKWGERTHGFRSDKARDNGLMLHAYGEDGAFSVSWINSIEVNVFEGGTGEILVLASTDDKGVKAPTRITAEVVHDKNGKPVWKKGAPKEVFPPADKRISRVNWRDQVPNWKDVKGFRGAKDIENPVGEWNRVEVICEGSTMRVYVNGEFVNEATDCYPSAGYVALQTEFAELWVRRYELHPLGTFKEKWTEEKRSKDIAFESAEGNVLPRRFPLSPEESAKLWKIGGDYDIQLVAREPLTCDPVDLTWDEQGRLFVAEMGDYPLPVGDDGPFLSRIRLLTDKDGDGVMDTAVTWADGLDHVQGLLRINNGLLVTTHTQILFLTDTDGDDVADTREVLFTVNAPIHGQLQISSPRYGLDNHVWISNGLQAKEITKGTTGQDKIDITRLNLRYNPQSGKIEPASGHGQFGGSLDDWNRHFYCSNRNPLMVSVMPLESVRRNPLAGILAGHEDALPSASPVYPLNLTHTTTPGEAGSFTAACGLCVYRGDRMPELAGKVLVCEPTAELISLNELTPKGASFTAKTIEDGLDFLVSGDEWTRPVQVRNGPDGAIYICDMYRRFIDHPIYFPKEFAETHYMRAGLDQGRIWRLVPKGTPAKAPTPMPKEIDKLVQELDNANGWRRTEAQRILVKKADAKAIPLLIKLLAETPHPKTQAHALWTLAGLEVLKAEHLRPVIKNATESGLLENALFAAHQNGLFQELAPDFQEALSKDFPRFRFLYIALNPDPASLPDAKTLADYVLKSPLDQWLRKAISASAPQTASPILSQLLDSADFSALSTAQVTEIIEDFSSLIAARGEGKELASLLSRLGKEMPTRQLAIVAGVSSGLVRSKLPQHSLADLIAANLPELSEGTEQLKAVLAQATTIALDEKADTADRLSALDLVKQRSWAERRGVAEKLITYSEPAAIQRAACQLLSQGDRTEIATFFFDRWSALPPAATSAALDILVAHPTSLKLLLDKMKAGDINRGLMPLPARRNAARHGKEEIRALAQDLFGTLNDDRSAVVADYVEKIAKLKGDAGQGVKVFEKAACITCHKIGDIGTEVGPSLADVKIKHAEALVSDILDPNRVVEERWISQSVETTDGRTLAGLLDGADSAAVTLRMPGGAVASIPKTEVKSLTSTGTSLMPVGLEQVISPQEMADLIAFLKKR